MFRAPGSRGIVFNLQGAAVPGTEGFLWVPAATSVSSLLSAWPAALFSGQLTFSFFLQQGIFTAPYDSIYKEQRGASHHLYFIPFPALASPVSSFVFVSHTHLCTEGQRELVMHTLASHPKWVSLLCRGPELTARSVLGGCAADRSSVSLLHPRQPTRAWNHDNHQHALPGGEACGHYLPQGSRLREQTNTCHHVLLESVYVDFFSFFLIYIFAGALH